MQSRLGIVERALDWLQSASGLSLVFFGILAFVLIRSFYGRYAEPDFRDSLIAELHGMLLDLLVIGAFIQGFSALGARRHDRLQRIGRWQEEIEDYLGWDEKEATLRIVGNIKRLNREGVSNITLVNAYLPAAQLYLTNLRRADMRGANLRGASLFRVDLRGADLWQADLLDADLRGAKFDKTTLWPEGFDPKAAGAFNMSPRK